jgi:hypothetical protein
VGLGECAGRKHAVGELQDGEQTEVLILCHAPLPNPLP